MLNNIKQMFENIEIETLIYTEDNGELNQKAKCRIEFENFRESFNGIKKKISECNTLKETQLNIAANKVLEILSEDNSFTTDKTQNIYITYNNDVLLKLINLAEVSYDMTIIHKILLKKKDKFLDKKTIKHIGIGALIGVGLMALPCAILLKK